MNFSHIWRNLLRWQDNITKFFATKTAKFFCEAYNKYEFFLRTEPMLSNNNRHAHIKLHSWVLQHSPN